MFGIVTSYSGTSGNYTLIVNPAAPTLTGITITTPATKTTYTVGDTLDITGLVVTGTYSDSSTQVEPITSSDVTGFDSSTANPAETLTITYDGFTATYDVAINAPSVVTPTLGSIAITTPATVLTYTVGDSLDITGLVVTGTMSDQSTQVEPITTADVTGFDSSTANSAETLTITYGGFTTTYNVAINAPTPPATGTITISPSTLPDGMVGTAYLQALTASGGIAPSVDESVYGSVYDQIVTGSLVYTFSVDGNLPGGLELSSGSIQGTPTTSGSFPFTVNVTDNNNETGSQPYTMTVDPLLVVQPTIAGLTVTPSTMSLIVAQQGSAVATAVYSDASTANVTKMAVWTSSNDKIATVNAGQITAVSPGTATITATYDGQSGTITVTVTAPVVSSGGGAVTPVIPITPVIPVIPITPVIPIVPVVPIVPVTPIVPVVPVTPVAPVAPIVPVTPVTLLPHETHSGVTRTNIVPVVTPAVVPTPVVTPVVAPTVVPIVTPTPAKRSPVPPVVPVVGGLAILGIIAALIQKRSYAALLLLLPFRVASIGISSQFVGLAAISLAFDDTKRKPSRVTVDVFKSNGAAIAKGVVVTRGQSTNIGFPVMGLGEKTRLTVKARGYRNTSKNKSVDIPVR
jgi:hypothetical protein